MTLNRENIQHVSKLMELMFKGGVILFTGIFQKAVSQGRRLNLQTLNMHYEVKTKLHFIMTVSVLTCQFAGPKYVNIVLVFFLVQQKSLHHSFLLNLLNDSEQKQVMATEVYLLWIFCKKNAETLMVIIQNGNSKTNFLT